MTIDDNDLKSQLITAIRLNKSCDGLLSNHGGTITCKFHVRILRHRLQLPQLLSQVLAGHKIRNLNTFNIVFPLVARCNNGISQKFLSPYEAIYFLFYILVFITCMLSDATHAMILISSSYTNRLIFNGHVRRKNKLVCIHNEFTKKKKYQIDRNGVNTILNIYTFQFKNYKILQQ